jgi:uncharacterized protein (DUF1810 family)
VDDPHDLERFVVAQAGCYDDVVGELTRGSKTSHWMWFVFPQIAGLGSSSMALRFALRSLAEAEAYASHPVLGARLRQCVRLMLGVEGRTAPQILGGVDALKFRSSMTLFAAAQPDEPLFVEALTKFYAGQRDARTLALLPDG